MKKPLCCRFGLHCDHLTHYEQFERRDHRGLNTYQESESTYACCRFGCERRRVMKYRPPGCMWWAVKKDW